MHWPTVISVTLLVVFWIWTVKGLSWFAVVLSYGVWVYLVLFIWKPSLPWWGVAGIWLGVFSVYGLSMLSVANWAEEEIRGLTRAWEEEKDIWAIIEVFVKILTFPVKPLGWVLKPVVSVRKSARVLG